jgi:hypothetical protein
MQPGKLALLISCLLHVALERQGSSGGPGGIAAASRLLQQEQPPQEPLTPNPIEEFPVVPSSELLVTSASQPFPTGAGIQYLRPEDAIQGVPNSQQQDLNPNNPPGSTTPSEPLLPTSTPTGSATSALISLLQPPPPGTTPPPLNQTQLANIPILQKLRQGVATVVYQRSVGNYDGTNMNCGTGYLNDYYKDHFVGVSLPMYRGGEVCGACIQLYCVDAACAAPLVTNKTFMVVDSCRECKGNDLVISARGSLNLSGVNYNINPSIQVAWKVTSCAPLLTGGIRMLPSKNNSKVFLGLNFSNLKVLLKSVVLDGMTMQRTDYGFWVIDTPGSTIPLTRPYELQLTGVTGQVLTMRVAALMAQDLGVNFD